MRASGEMAKAVDTVDFDALEDTPHKLYLGEPVLWV